MAAGLSVSLACAPCSAKLSRHQTGCLSESGPKIPDPATAGQRNHPCAQSPSRPVLQSWRRASPEVENSTPLAASWHERHVAALVTMSRGVEWASALGLNVTLLLLDMQLRVIFQMSRVLDPLSSDQRMHITMTSILSHPFHSFTAGEPADTNMVLICFIMISPRFRIPTPVYHGRWWSRVG
ncbi:hypothetical protein EDB81DRAFT_265066 [Dactylonectria macrodidyma]|uniref:Uncharacterized protein n=1 Tax=Dactylonectria macrodidyma TaxID=307937 RepID=A0A9P9FKW9_9HYPO|nr:hypothetical protein EDB81DRAFT_265066 [Dactylonectria macrodidyma]